jgi:hypothetical protein
MQCERRAISEDLLLEGSSPTPIVNVQLCLMRDGHRPAWTASRHQMRGALTSRIMARTTLDIDPAILRELRRRATRDRKSMGQVASELLAMAVATSADADEDVPFAWRTGDLGAPPVDLEDKEALQRALEAQRP